MDAIDHGLQIHEVDGDVSNGWSTMRTLHFGTLERRGLGIGSVELRVPAPRLRRHQRGGRPPLSGAKCRHQLATRGVIESRHVDGAVALVAQHFHYRGQTLFRGRLELAVHYAQQMHLQGLDQKILGVSAIRTRQGQ